MAKEIGSASNLEDFFSKIVTFLTTNSDLVAASRSWEVMRIRRDNILSVSTDLTLVSGSGITDLKYLMHYDSRMLNSDNPGVSNSFSGMYASGFSSGKHITMRLRNAKSVRSVVLKAPPDFIAYYMPTSFSLQYSDDGTTFTNCYTSSTLAFATSERMLLATGNNGSHVHWRIIFNSPLSTLTLNELILLDETGEVANQYGSEVIFKSKGISGTDSIYTGIRAQYSEVSGWYNLFLNGFTGYSSIEPSFYLQPGAIPNYGQIGTKSVPMVALWDNTMPYWFSATGGSFTFVAKVSTVFEAGYLGFINPYATPNQYPYPLAVGGSLTPDVNDRSTPWRYSYASAAHSVFVNPGSKSSQVEGSPQSTTLYLRSPSGAWVSFSNRPATYSADDASIAQLKVSETPPYIFTGINNNVSGTWPYITAGNTLPVSDCIGGGYTVDHVELYSIDPVLIVFGAFNGLFAISGSNNSSENTTTINGKDAVIFQNTYRTNIAEYWALILE